jgi:hypothetical protein
MISIRLEDPDQDRTLAMAHEFTHAVEMQAESRELVCPIGRPRITRLCH